MGFVPLGLQPGRHVRIADGVGGAELALEPEQPGAVEPGVVDEGVDATRHRDRLGRRPPGAEPGEGARGRLVEEEVGALVVGLPRQLEPRAQPRPQRQRRRERELGLHVGDDGAKAHHLGARGQLAVGHGGALPVVVDDEAGAHPLPGEPRAQEHGVERLGAERARRAGHVTPLAERAAALACGCVHAPLDVAGFVARARGAGERPVVEPPEPRGDAPRHLAALQRTALPGDDVDDRQLGRAAVERRAGAANDLEPLDGVREHMVAELGARVEQLVHLLPVEHHQHLALVPPQVAEGDAHHARDVVMEGEARHQLEHLEQVSRARGDDVVARQQHHHVGRLEGGARVAGRDLDPGVEQGLEGEVVDVGAVGQGRRGPKARHQRHESVRHRRGKVGERPSGASAFLPLHPTGVRPRAAGSTETPCAPAATRASARLSWRRPTSAPAAGPARCPSRAW